MASIYYYVSNLKKALSFLLILSPYCFSLFIALISCDCILKYVTFIEELLCIIDIFYGSIEFYDRSSCLFICHGFGLSLMACNLMIYGFVARCFDICCKLSCACSFHLVSQDRHSLMIAFSNQLVMILDSILLDIFQVNIDDFDRRRYNFFIFLFIERYFCKAMDFSCLLLKID